MVLAARLAVSLLAAAVSSSPPTAQIPDAQLGNLIVSGASVRATPPGVSVGALYFSVRNAGVSADRLESVSTPVAKTVQLHATRDVNGVMQMRAVQGVECPPGATVKAEPGGLHVMLIGLSAPLRLGTTIDISLQFRAAGVLRLKVPVT